MARSYTSMADAEGQGGAFQIGRQSEKVVRDSSEQGDANRIGVTLFKITGEKGFLAADKFYTTTFTTLNGSGVTGEAIIGFDVDSGRITVAISAAGLEPDQTHIQHIHGFPDGTDAKTPTSAFDTDGDGFIELAEGAPSYGPILLDLSTDHSNGAGGDNGHSHGGLSGFPTAPDGTIWFIESYDLPAGMLRADPMLDLREIVIHGRSVPAGTGAGTTGEIDGTSGYKLVLPVASGELAQVSSFAEFTGFINDNAFAEDAAAHQASQGDYFLA